MITSRDLLNRIKWDKNLKNDLFSIGYIDNVLKKIIWIDYKEIIRLDGSFMVLLNKGEETYIPLHRIRKVRQNGKLIWERKDRLH